MCRWDSLSTDVLCWEASSVSEITEVSVYVSLKWSLGFCLACHSFKRLNHGGLIKYGGLRGKCFLGDGREFSAEMIRIRFVPTWVKLLYLFKRLSKCQAGKLRKVSLVYFSQWLPSNTTGLHKPWDTTTQPHSRLFQGTKERKLELYISQKAPVIGPNWMCPAPKHKDTHTNTERDSSQSS